MVNFITAVGLRVIKPDMASKPPMSPSCWQRTITMKNRNRIDRIITGLVTLFLLGDDSTSLFAP